MCENGDAEDIVGIELSIKKQWNECKKCGGTNGLPCMAVRSDEPPSCQYCFLQTCTHKFRTSFGKSQLLRKGEGVLVAYSGGHCSLALLHLINEALNENEHRRLRFTPTFVYLDDSDLFGTPSCKDEVHTTLHSSGFKYEILDMKEACETASIYPHSNPCENGDNHENSLLQMYRSLKEKEFPSNFSIGGSKEERRQSMLYWILINVAHRHNLTLIFLADCCTRLSQRLLTHVVAGRADQSSTALAFLDQRFSGFKFVHPLREFSVKEIVLFNRYKKRKAVVQTNWETGTDPEASIDRLTEHFLASLQPDFPSTVFTVFRTGTKLTRGRAESSPLICRICQNPFVSAPEDLAIPCAWNALRQTHHLLGKELSIDNTLCYSCQIVQK